MLDDRFSYEKRVLGERIKTLRKQRGFKQIDLSVIVGMDRGEISRIENGKVNLELLTIVRIADALKVELFELFLPELTE